MQNPVLIAGCGPSILNVPYDLWFAMPVIGVNRFPAEHAITPEYWTAWDTWSLVEMLPIVSERKSKIYLNKRIFEYYNNTFKDEDYDINWWTDMSGPPGIPTNPKTGLVFTTTTHAAVWLGHRLGFDAIFIVGFDCTQGYLHNNHHFYGEPVDSKYNPKWDTQMGDIAVYLENMGTFVVNLSSPTKACSVPWARAEDIIERYQKDPR